MRLDLLVPRLDWSWPPGQNGALPCDYPPGPQLCLLATNLESLVVLGSDYQYLSLATTVLSKLRHFQCLGMTLGLQDWRKFLASHPNISRLCPPRIGPVSSSIVDEGRNQLWPSVHELVFQTIDHFKDHVAVFPKPGAFPNLRSLVLCFIPSRRHATELTTFLSAHGKFLRSLEVCLRSEKEHLVPSFIFPSFTEFCPILTTITWRVASSSVNVSSFPDERADLVLLRGVTTLKVEYLEREADMDEDDYADLQKSRLGRRGSSTNRWDRFLHGTEIWAKHLPDLRTIRFSHEGNVDFLQRVYPASFFQFLQRVEQQVLARKQEEQKKRIRIKDENGKRWKSSKFQ